MDSKSLVFGILGFGLVASCGGKDKDKAPGASDATASSDTVHSGEQPDTWGPGAAGPDTSAAWPKLAPASDDLGSSHDLAGCDTPFQYFQEETWPQALVSCSGCHGSGGFYEVQGGQHFVLKLAAPTASNFAVVRQLGQKLVDKAQGLDGHLGGSVLPAGAPGLASLSKLITMLSDPALCSTENPASEAGDAAVSASSPVVDEAAVSWPLWDNTATLRKASVRLLGRLPSAAEIAQVADGSEAAFTSVLMAYMQEPAFYEHLKDLFNDLLLTDGVKFENRYTGVIDSALPSELVQFPLTWGNFPGYLPYNDLNGHAADSMAREPLEIIAHVVRQNRPFTEILTGQYRLLNRLTAESLKIDTATLGFVGSADDYSEFVEVALPAINGEYAGVLTTTAFLYRYPDTGSNRNRKRARYFYKYFLGFDVMKDSVRIDLSKVDLSADPWRHNDACTGCHKIIDPVAGAFQNWTNCYGSGRQVYLQPNERYCGPNGWFAAENMFQPGTGPESADNKIALGERHQALTLLGEATANKRSFARAMTAHVYDSLVGKGIDESLRQAGIESLTDLFVSSNHDLKALIVGIIKSPFFRTSWGQLLGPELLNDKINAVLGHFWGVEKSKLIADEKVRRNDSPYYLRSMKKYRLLAGGIDSVQIQKRATEPSALHAAVTARMALEMACAYTAHDFALPGSQRLLFPKVDRSDEPSAMNQSAIVDNLRYLHERILGESLSADDPEILASLALLEDAWASGKAKIKSGSASANLPTGCRAVSYLDTGMAQAMPFSDDQNYMVRAWQAVLAYMLLDYKTLYQ